VWAGRASAGFRRGSDAGVSSSLNNRESPHADVWCGVVLSLALWFLSTIASAGPIVTCYRYEFPPQGQQGPPNRICFQMKLLDADVSKLPEMPEDLHAGPPVTNPHGVGGVHWVVNDALWFGPRPGADPLDDQVDI
jgi:hypothetical protein